MNPNVGSGPFLRLSFLGVTLWCLFVLGLYFWPAGTLIDRIEWRTVDWRFQLRGPLDPQQKIVIVTVDEESIKAIGRWPWPRKHYADLIERLKAARARKVVFDIFFTEHDVSVGGPPSDARLAEATRVAGNVYHAGFIYEPQRSQSGAAPAPPPAVQERAWGARVVKSGGLAAVADVIDAPAVTFPLPDLVRAAKGFGIANIQDSGDGIYRHLIPLIRYRDKLYPSVALAVAADELGVRPEDVVVKPGRYIDLGGKQRIPLDMQGLLLINFIGEHHSFDYVSAVDVLQHSEELDRDIFRDAIVLVGVTAPGIYDLRANPFSTIYNGVEAQANAIDCIVSGRFLRQAPPLQTALLLLTIIPIFGLLLPRLNTAVTMPLALVALLSYPSLGINLFTRQHILIELVNPMLAMTGSVMIILVLRLLVEERRRHQAQTILCHFVPPQLVGRLVEEEALMTLRGERREISVLFADLRNFTATAEALAPEETVTFLNRYFALMHEVIWEHEGTLDKYIGDEIMVFHNAPVAQPDHALRSLMTAIEMQRRIMANRAEWEYLRVPELNAGIGIATGQAVVGYVGSPERMQYTVIGQTVNLASRLQALCKQLGCRILISDETYQAVTNVILAQDLGEVRLPGLQQPVRVWHVLDYRDEELRGQWEPVGTPIAPEVIARVVARTDGSAQTGGNAV